jgi:predicted metal-dependent peptidase
MADILERFEAARLWLSLRVPFLGRIVHGLRPRLSRPADAVPTAAVAPDGTLVLNEAFCASLTDPQLRFLVAHEALHPALGYWARLGDRDPALFNEAHDIAINLLIDAFAWRVTGLATPPGVSIERQFLEDSAEEIYAHLAHWRAPALPMAAGGGSGSASPAVCARDCRADLADSPKGRAAHGANTDATRALEREWADRVRHALSPDSGASANEEPGCSQPQVGRGWGTLPAELRILIAASDAPPAIDWRDALRAWLGAQPLTADLSYRRPSRRAESAGEVLARVVHEGVPVLTILWDTSGSMVGEAEAIFHELREIVDGLGLSVRLIACDARIQADVATIDAAEDAVQHAIGGGGSDFEPAFERLDREGAATLVIAFTDGWITVPAEPPPSLIDTLWVITPHGGAPASWGSVIRLTTGGGGR